MAIATLMTFFVVAFCIQVLDAISKGWLMDKGLEIVRLVEIVCKVTATLVIATLLISIIFHRIV